MKLTKEHIKLMKKADTVCFSTKRKGHDAYDSEIVLLKNEKDSRIDIGRIQALTQVNQYGSAHLRYVEKCFDCVSNSKYSLEWISIVDALKAGDTIKLLWMESCNNNHLNKLGLHHDKLYIQIERQVRGKTVYRRFLLSESVEPDSEFRMIRSV